MLDKLKTLWYNTQALSKKSEILSIKFKIGPWKLNNDDEEKGTRNWIE